MRYLVIVLLLLGVLFAKESTMSIYDFTVEDIDGNKVSLSHYKGDILLIVNVASECGFTPQYAGLEKLYQEFKDQGFMVLGFPSNQFLSQEPGTNKEIKFFCQGTYNVHFDMFAKIDVNGDNTVPLYNYLKTMQGGFLGFDAIKWNFTKFLVDTEGNVLKRYGPSTQPEDIKADIVKLLEQ
jgi:glutathione peroxidase